MATKSVSEFCGKVKYNKFGGAAEMVEDGVKSIVYAARNCEVRDVNEFNEQMESDLDSILEVIPSIAPMTNLLHTFMFGIDEIKEKGMNLDQAREEIASSLTSYLDRQSKALEVIGQIGSQLIKNHSQIATFSTSGSVMEIFKESQRNGKIFNVVVTEARPANEGIRTMKEVAELGIPVTFGIDAILGYLLPGSAMFLAGADVINSLGEVLVKVGTYLGALVAREHNIPFYVVADTSKFDPMTMNGFPLKIKDKGPDKVLDETLPTGVNILNPSFELIPAHLVTGYITEIGVITPGSVSSFMKEAKISKSLTKKLQTWVQKPNS